MTIVVDFLRRRLLGLQAALQADIRSRYNRRVSFGDLITDRWVNAREYGFGEGTSCYDNVLIIGDVKVGKNCWIGPNVVLDGSGGLEIGDYCSISAGVQIYTHSTVDWAISHGNSDVIRRHTKIGSGVYIGPNTVIEMGSEVGNSVVIGAMSLVKGRIPDHCRAWGTPAVVQITGP